MGFFDIFSRKKSQETEEIKREIYELRRNFEKLSQKVSITNENMGTIYELIEEMLKDIETNKKLAERTIKSSVFDHASQKTSIDFNPFETRMDNLEENARIMKKKIETLMPFMKLSIRNHDEIEEIKKHIASETAPVKNTKLSDSLTKEDDFSSKERKVINALLNSEISLTYEEISGQVDLSPITVKGYINAIKKKFPGIIIEDSKGRGRKVYSLKQEYKLNVLSGQGNN